METTEAKAKVPVKFQVSASATSLAGASTPRDASLRRPHSCLVRSLVLSVWSCKKFSWCFVPKETRISCGINYWNMIQFLLFYRNGKQVMPLFYSHRKRAFMRWLRLGSKNIKGTLDMKAFQDFLIMFLTDLVHIIYLLISFFSFIHNTDDKTSSKLYISCIRKKNMEPLHGFRLHETSPAFPVYEKNDCSFEAKGLVLRPWHWGCGRGGCSAAPGIVCQKLAFSALCAWPYRLLGRAAMYCTNDTHI